MRVLFASYSLAFQNSGGGELVLTKTASALKASGVELDLYNPWLHDLDNYDLIHYFSLIETGFWSAVRNLKKKPAFVVTPTFWGGKTTQMSRFQKFFDRQMPDWYRGFVSRADFVDHWFPTTQLEKSMLCLVAGLSSTRCTVISNAVDQSFSTADALHFRKHFNLYKPFILHVGRFDEVKNQLSLITACKKNDVELVLVGGSDLRSPGYFEKCKLVAGDSKKIHFIGALPPESDLLKSAYMAASAFVLPSKFETFGLSAHEALLAGIPLVYVTKNCASIDTIEKYVSIFDPAQTDETIKKISARLPQDYREEIRRQDYKPLNWQDVSLLLLKEYQKVIAQKKIV